MVRLNVNLDEVGSARAVIPAGRYEARLTDCTEKQSSTDNPMLEWTWEISAGDHQGAELRSFTSLQEHALFGLKSHLEAFGVSGEVDMDTDKLVGKSAVLVVVTKTIKNRNTDEDMEVNRINMVLPAAKKAGGAVVQAGKAGAKTTGAKTKGGMPF